MGKFWILPVSLALVTLTGFTCSKNKDQAQSGGDQEPQPIVEVQQQEPISLEGSTAEAPSQTEESQPSE